MATIERGDFIKMDFDNTQGHEQSNYHRALVISPGIYNQKVRLAIVCAITNQKKGYPFEVDIPAGLKVTGVILSDQIRTIDWVARNVQVVDKAPAHLIDAVLHKIALLIQ